MHVRNVLYAQKTLQKYPNSLPILLTIWNALPLLRYHARSMMEIQPVLQALKQFYEARAIVPPSTRTFLSSPRKIRRRVTTPCPLSDLCPSTTSSSGLTVLVTAILGLRSSLLTLLTPICCMPSKQSMRHGAMKSHHHGWYAVLKLMLGR
jgi:hypothetical protein